MKRRGLIWRILLLAVLAAALCAVCAGSLAEEIDAQDHVWDEGQMVEPATCSAPELWIYHCTLPGCNAVTYKFKGESKPDAHEWGEWIIDKEATCTTDGARHRVCKIVVHHIEKAVIPATGHDWGPWVVTTQPTCEEPGEETSVCRNDPSHVKTQLVPATGHDWGDWVITTPPTCTEKGEATSTCKNDPTHTKTRPVDALGHDWGEWAVTTPPTCTEEGVETRVCKNDPSHTETRPVNPIGHKWDEGKVIKQPTLDEDGEKLYTCENNPAHTKTEILPKLYMRNNTVCAFGPRLRDMDLKPHNTTRWYMFTPFDASEEGIQTYELVASNNVIVGELTLEIKDGAVSVDYTLFDSKNFKITLEFFTILGRIQDISKYEPEELKTLDMEIKTPYNLAENFGEDTNLVLYFCSRCDYTSSPYYKPLAYNSIAHRFLLSTMKALMD